MKSGEIVAVKMMQGLCRNDAVMMQGAIFSTLFLFVKLYIAGHYLTKINTEIEAKNARVEQ